MVRCVKVGDLVLADDPERPSVDGDARGLEIVRSLKPLSYGLRNGAKRIQRAYDHAIAAVRAFAAAFLARSRYTHGLARNLADVVSKFYRGELGGFVRTGRQNDGGALFLADKLEHLLFAAGKRIARDKHRQHGRCAKTLHRLTSLPYLTTITVPGLPFVFTESLPVPAMPTPLELS